MVQWLTLLSVQGVQVRSPVRELRAHIAKFFFKKWGESMDNVIGEKVRVQLMKSFLNFMRNSDLQRFILSFSLLLCLAVQDSKKWDLLLFPNTPSALNHLV